MQQHSENESTDPGRHDNTPRWADCTMSTRPDAGAYDAPAGSAGEASEGAKPAVLYISYLLSGKFMDVVAFKRKNGGARNARLTKFLQFVARFSPKTFGSKTGNS